MSTKQFVTLRNALILGGTMFGLIVVIAWIARDLGATGALLP